MTRKEYGADDITVANEKVRALGLSNVRQRISAADDCRVEGVPEKRGPCRQLLQSYEFKYGSEI